MKEGFPRSSLSRAAKTWPKGDWTFSMMSFVCAASSKSPARLRSRSAGEKGWLEPGQPFWYNAGIYIFRPSLFEFTAQLHKSPRGEYELPDAINAMVAAQHRIAGLEIAGRWVDVRDPAVLAALENGEL